MHRFAKFASGWFHRHKEKGNGLSVSLQELMEERKDLNRLHQKTKLVPSDMAGEVRSAFKGRGIEMEEIREYTFGDDVRDIDWRVTARKKTPYTKVYAEEKDREIYVLLDLSPSMVFGTQKELKSVTASKIAALIGWMAQENGDRFGAVIYDGEKLNTFKSQQNRAHLLAVLKKISEIGHKILTNYTQGKSMGAHPLQVMSKLIRSRAAVFIISDFKQFGDSEKKALSALAKKGQIFCINVFDTLETKAPKSGEYMVAEQGKTLVFDTRSKSFCRQYQKVFADKRQYLKTFCQNMGCHYIEVRNNEDILSQLKII